LNKEIPSFKVVYDSLQELGDGITAVQLCDNLVDKGYSRKYTQLGIQRAHDKRVFDFGKSWRLFRNEQIEEEVLMC